MKFLKGTVRGFWIGCLILVAVYAYARWIGLDEGRSAWAMYILAPLALLTSCLLMGFAGLSHKGKKGDVAGADDPRGVQ